MVVRAAQSVLFLSSKRIKMVRMYSIVCCSTTCDTEVVMSQPQPSCMWDVMCVSNWNMQHNLKTMAAAENLWISLEIKKEYMLLKIIYTVYLKKLSNYWFVFAKLHAWCHVFIKYIYWQLYCRNLTFTKLTFCFWQKFNVDSIFWLWCYVLHILSTVFAKKCWFRMYTSWYWQHHNNYYYSRKSLWFLCTYYFS